MIDRTPFGPADLPEDQPPAELATSLATARELEAMTSGSDQPPGEDFADRVMAAIALEPVPQPATVAGSALRRGRPLGLLAAVRDAWRVALSGGRPLAVRAQALALVLVAAVAVGSLLSAGGYAVAGALGLFSSDPPAVLPSPSPSPSLPPSPSPSVPPSPSPTPSASPSPVSTPVQTDETETESPGATDDDGGGNSGPGGGGDDSGSGSGSSGSGSDDVASGSGADDPPGHVSAGGRSGADEG
jgi:uncharacterized membrane protein YgcG